MCVPHGFAQKPTFYFIACVVRAPELCERRGGRPGLPVPNSSYDLCGRKATLNFNCKCVLPDDVPMLQACMQPKGKQDSQCTSADEARISV